MSMIEGNYFDQLVSALNQTAIVSITDIRGKIVFANENFCTISGYSLPELIGRNHRILNSGTHPKEFFDNLWNALRQGKVWSGEIQNKKKNGETYWVQSTISAIVNEKKEIVNYVAILFEITQMKQAQTRLAESSRLASLGEMASGIAHEINNPLTIILGRLTIAQKKIERNDPPEVVIKELQTIERTVFRISNIINGLKKLARESSFDPIETFDIVQLINESRELYSQKLTKHEVKFIFNYKDPILVNARPLQLSQVLLNLVNNSVDAIENMEDKWIQINITKHEDLCSISVVDSGNGIPAEVAKKIMNPFFTTKDPGRGTGLGLSLSKKMVEDSNGRFFYDASKKNTTFCIELDLGNSKENVA
ncbi:MAG: PAS domain-containing protein [Bdellovibrionaceae bacterium]|nr:PAS domain-containing protein [Pseudobdellovibrionaceae bacterium]